MLLRAPRHRAQYARTRITRTHTTVYPESDSRRSCDNAHRCRAASSPWRRRTNSASPATERVTITPPRSRCIRVVVNSKQTPRLHPQKRSDLRTMMTPTERPGKRLQFHANAAPSRESPEMVADTIFTAPRFPYAK